MDWRWIENGKRIKILLNDLTKRSKYQANEMVIHPNPSQLYKIKLESLIQREIALYKRQIQEVSYKNCSESY
jgi:hypothetical protein